MPSNDENENRNKLHSQVYRVFNDDMMIGLAAILACVVILPIFFTFTHTMMVLFDYVNYIIIFAFVAEYLLKLYVDTSRREFVTNPLHILDLFIIIIALLDLTKLAFVPYLILEQGKLSPVLRLIRVFLAIALAGRTAKRVLPQELTTIKVSPPELLIGILDQKGNRITKNKKNILPTLDEKKPLWIDMQYVSENDLDFIKGIVDIPDYVLESKLIKESFPRIDRIKNYTSIFLWDSRIDPNSTSVTSLNIISNDMLIICTGASLLTLSTKKSDLFNDIKFDELPHEHDEFAIRVLSALLRKKIYDYGAIVQSIERKTIEFEEIPVDMTSPQFLENTFQFKKEIQKIISNLWHFKQILEYIIKNKASLNGLNDNHAPIFDILHEESEYMYETAQNTKENLMSLIELHINTVSYDMNRVIKVIAVITCLAIIPSIIGGLLGENLLGQPYPVTITEVFFVVFSLMLLSLYIFYKKNWLR
jgi:Mg2+ and Co2+ transporter CorA